MKGREAAIKYLIRVNSLIVAILAENGISTEDPIKDLINAIDDGIETLMKKE